MQRPTEKILPLSVARDGFTFGYKGSKTVHKLDDDGVNPPSVWLYFVFAHYEAIVANNVRINFDVKGSGETIRQAHWAVNEQLKVMGMEYELLFIANEEPDDDQAE